MARLPKATAASTRVTLGALRPSASGERRQHSFALLLIGIGLLAILYWRFGTADIVTALTGVRAGYLLIYAVLACTAVLGSSIRWLVLARASGVRLPLRRFVQARLAGDSVGTIIPGKVAGDPIRVALMSSPGVETARITAGVAADRVVEWLASALCAILYVTVFSVTRTGPTGLRTSVLLAGLAVGLVALAIPLVMLRGGRRPFAPFYQGASRPDGAQSTWRDVMRRTEDHLGRLLREHPGVFASGLVMSFAIEAIVVLEYHYLLAAFGVTLALPVLFIVLFGSGVAQLIPTPVNLGGLEGSQVVVLTAAGGGPALGLLIGTVLRLHNTLWVCIGLAVLVWRGSSLTALVRSHAVVATGSEPPPAR